MTRRKVVEVKKEATGHTGVRRIVRTYDDGTVTKRYEVRFKDAHGELRGGGTYDRLDEARAVYKRLAGEVDRREYIPPEQRATTFKTVADAWLALPDTRTAKVRTRTGYRALVNGRLAPLHDVAVGDLDKERLTAFVVGLMDDGLKPRTIRNAMQVVARVLDHAVDLNRIPAHPARLVPMPKVKDAPRVDLRLADVHALIQHTPAPWDLLVRLAAFSGLRAGELMGLRVRHLHLARRAVQVEETVVDVDGVLTQDEPKSDAGRRAVPDLPRSLCDALAVHVAGKAPDDYVFGWEDATGTHPYRHGNFYRRVFTPAVRAAGLPAATRFHDLRGFYASLLVNAGLDHKIVQKRMGHANIATTLDVYARAWDTDHGGGLGDAIDAQLAALGAEQNGLAPVLPLRGRATG